MCNNSTIIITTDRSGLPTRSHAVYAACRSCQRSARLVLILLVQYKGSSLANRYVIGPPVTCGRSRAYLVQQVQHAQSTYSK